MELLVLKTGSDYLHIKPDGFEIVNMSKASVYPITQKDQVFTYLKTYQGEIKNLRIKKLVITEHDYE